MKRAAARGRAVSPSVEKIANAKPARAESVAHSDADRQHAAGTSGEARGGGEDDRV
jgi:hypothetical protein